MRQIPQLTAKDIGRFWSYVDRKASEDCWLWLGWSGDGRYGDFTTYTGSDRQLSLKAHRVSYFLEHDVDPSDLMVLHRCDVTKCVNPAHLFLGTCQDNRDDCLSKGRQSKGVKHGRAKLTEEQVKRIRYLSNFGYEQISLGLRFGVSQTVISLILRGKIWNHI